MTDYTIWRPEYDGHAPPNWRDGMGWDCEPFREDGTLIFRDSPRWFSNGIYRVPAEALNSPNDDVEDEELTYPRRSIQEALVILHDYSADELAKHGITLAPEKDVFAELADELKDTFIGYWPMLLRTRFEQMKGEA